MNLNSATSSLPSIMLTGKSIGGNFSWGHALIHQAPQIRTNSRLIQNTLSPTQELARFDFALEKLSQEIDDLIIALEDNQHQDILEIINAYKMVSLDKTWHQQVADRIAQGWPAEDALLAFFMDYRQKFSTEIFWQIRLLDLEDMQNRLLRILGDHNQRKFPGPAILIADHLGPADVLFYRQHNLAGLILGQNQPTSHAVIVAKSLGISIIIGVEDLLSIQAGDPILMNGENGTITVRPHLDDLVYSTQEDPLIGTDISNPLQTSDGVPINLLMNASLVSDVHIADQGYVSGIGLYRTEIPFMMKQKLPTISEQVHLYREILTAAGNKPVTFRTLDISGDKILPYLSYLWEENPDNRLHAFRVLVDRPLLLRYQLRALIRAARGRVLRLLLPMIATAQEWTKFKKLIDLELAREEKLGHELPRNILLGAMIEIPSLVYDLPHLLPQLDFISVGSNDLFCSFFGLTRDHPQNNQQYDTLSPPFLLFLKEIVDRCAIAHIPLTLCGEMASNPLDILALVGIGFRSFSVSPAAHRQIYQCLRLADCQELTKKLDHWLQEPTINLRDKL